MEVLTLILLVGQDLMVVLVVVEVPEVVMLEDQAILLHKVQLKEQMVVIQPQAHPQVH